MDINNGRLIDAEALAAMEMSERERFQPVPEGLNRAARRALAGRNEVTINLKGRSPLAKWAEAKRKAKRKAQRNARKAHK